MIADIVGMPLERLPTAGGSATGAAFAAGIGIGMFSAWKEIERFVEVAGSVEPVNHDAYEKPYRTYRALYPALKEVMR